MSSDLYQDLNRSALPVTHRDRREVILLGPLKADAGRAEVLGGDPWRDAVALHARLAGYLRLEQRS
jgi:hypothetical protein